MERILKIGEQSFTRENGQPIDFVGLLYGLTGVRMQNIIDNRIFLFAGIGNINNVTHVILTSPGSYFLEKYDDLYLNFRVYNGKKKSRVNTRLSFLQFAASPLRSLNEVFHSLCHFTGLL
jgi:hypothetical protein